ASNREELTADELKVAKRLANGQTSAEIAASLGLNIPAVEAHRSAALKKLGLSSRAGLVRVAAQRHWLDSRSNRQAFPGLILPYFRWYLHFRSHRRKFAHPFIETALEILRNIRVKWIRCQICRQRTVTKMLVHPEPGRGIFPDNWLELVPASLRHFLERGTRGKFNPGMKNHPVTPAGQRLAMDVDERRARALVQPHVSKGDAAFKPETLNRHGRQFCRNCQIHEQGEAFAAAQGPVQMHDGTFARRHAMAAPLAQLQEDRIKQWILELLGDHD